MTDIAKPSPRKPIADVAHPNNSAPSDTSKPVIVANRAILRDPMMTANSPTDNVASVQPANKLNIQPPATIGTEVATEIKSEPTTVSEVQPSNSAGAAPPDAKTATEQQSAEAEILAKRDAELQALVDSKRYFLPIDAVEQQQTKQFIIIGVVVSLVLVLIWLDLALDAGLIKLGGLKALTHFFTS